MFDVTVGDSDSQYSDVMVNGQAATFDSVAGVWKAKQVPFNPEGLPLITVTVSPGPEYTFANPDLSGWFGISSVSSSLWDEMLDDGSRLAFTRHDCNWSKAGGGRWSGVTDYRNIPAFFNGFEPIWNHAISFWTEVDEWNQAIGVSGVVPALDDPFWPDNQYGITKLQFETDFLLFGVDVEFYAGPDSYESHWDRAPGRQAGAITDEKTAHGNFNSSLSRDFFTGGRRGGPAVAHLFSMTANAYNYNPRNYDPNKAYTQMPAIGGGDLVALGKEQIPADTGAFTLFGQSMYPEPHSTETEFLKYTGNMVLKQEKLQTVAAPLHVNNDWFKAFPTHVIRVSPDIRGDANSDGSIGGDEDDIPEDWLPLGILIRHNHDDDDDDGVPDCNDAVVNIDPAKSGQF